MKRYLVILGIGAALALLPQAAFAQCRGGGGQATAASGAVAMPTGSGVVTSGQLLTSPGSLYYDMLLQQQMQQAIAQRQYAMAVAKAQKAQAKYEVRLANAQKHRSEAAYKQEIDRARRSTALAKR
jgi:hypothetical protein